MCARTSNGAGSRPLARLLLKTAAATRREPETAMESILGVHEAALLHRARRMEVLAANLANADTPRYQARDLTFAAVLDERMSAARQLTTTDRNHIRIDPLASRESLQYRIPHQPSLDGNTVEADLELARYAENAVSYQASLMFASGKISHAAHRAHGEPLMGTFSTFDIAGSALSAQSLRLNLTASNLANMHNVAGDPAAVYRARHAVFQAAADPFSSVLAGVDVLGVIESTDAADRALRPRQSAGERGRNGVRVERQRDGRDGEHDFGVALVPEQPRGDQHLEGLAVAHAVARSSLGVAMVNPIDSLGSRVSTCRKRRAKGTWGKRTSCT